MSAEPSRSSSAKNPFFLSALILRETGEAFSLTGILSLLLVSAGVIIVNRK